MCGQTQLSIWGFNYCSIIVFFFFFFFSSSHSHQIQLQRLIQEKTVMLTMCDSWSENVMDAKLRWAPGAA